MEKFTPKSHPKKYLKDHLENILKNFGSNELGVLATVFHDLGKMTDSFQRKISGNNDGKYSNHAYISTLLLINAFMNNEDKLIKRFDILNEDNFELILLILINVVISHHTNLRNITDMYKRQNSREWEDMIKYLKEDNIIEKANVFLSDNPHLLNCQIALCDDLDDKERIDYYKSYGLIGNNKTKWHENALDYYFETISTIGCLIYWDRKDASGNKIENRKNKMLKYNYSLENNLEHLFNKFSNNQNELNNVRTKIRNIAIKKLNQTLRLKPDNKVFTLTSPTGSGKTLMMLSLANEIIKKENYKYDILYALPFLSITDQITKVLYDDLYIDTLNYTSSSDMSREMERELQKNEPNPNLVQFAFSENSFDHPFIITTFNQLFETLLSNSNNKLLRMKNLKNRIFLIDEYQAINSTQHYLLMELLTKFCQKYNSYALISTATMPNFNININALNNENLKKLIKTQTIPIELLPKNIFENKVFNRYMVNFIGVVDNRKLVEYIIDNTITSSLVVMNQIKSSQELYNIFSREKTHNFEKIYLLNSYFTSNDRIIIVKKIKEDLKNNKKILVISTQVIEAGVDISFRTVFRDCAPLPNITQAFGRGNRNGEYGVINTYIFLYLNPCKKNYDCLIIYNDMISKKFITDIEQNKIQPMSEHEFHIKTNNYFYGISEYKKSDGNIINNIYNGLFNEVGEYRLIENDPDRYTIYVGKDIELWNKYIFLYEKMKNSKSFSERESNYILFKNVKSKIIQNTINIYDEIFEELKIDRSKDIFGIYRLYNTKNYSSESGLII